MTREQITAARVQRTLAGEIEAFGELVEDFQSPLRGFVAMLGVPAHAIDDLSQETFLQAYKAMATFDPTKPFAPWLRGIARNLVRRYMAEAAQAPAQQPGMVSRLLEDRDLDASDHEYLDHFHLSRLKKCMELLSARSMNLVHKRYFEGENSFEIARALNLTPESVRMALNRVRLQLRNCISRPPAPENTSG